MELARYIPWLPALGAVLCAVCCTRRSWRGAAAWVCIASLGAAFVLSAAVAGSVPDYDAQAVRDAAAAGQPLTAEHGVVTLFDWINVGGELQVDMGYFLDPLTILMLFVVTGIGTLVAIYAAGYMAGDRGYARFFAAVCLFIFAMTTLVMADNLVLLYLGWEGVGLCSYLLIGYYYDKPAAVAAAKKAFIVNRIGDLGFALGIFLTFMHYETLSLAEVTAKASTAQSAEDVWIPFLLMLGAFGKSAQIPLYVWLPDAMEGPTPVSALIHAATMVTAGVYMIARLMMVFSPTLSPWAMPTVAVIGGLTALFAATIALCQYDIKRIFAYSTISQLGYMFMGVGVLSTVGGVFHLFTHAFFKALLFLTAGSVMHALAGQLDLRKMSGLRQKMPVTCWLMFIGCLALAGFPLTAGFYSKDMILADTMARGLGERSSVLFILLGLVGLFTAFLTAFYTFRLWCRVFLGPLEYEMGDEHHHEDVTAHHNGTSNGFHIEHHHEPHEMPWLMNGPLVVLAAGSIFAGMFFGGWVERSIGRSTANVEQIVTHELRPGPSESSRRQVKQLAHNERAYTAVAATLLPKDASGPARALMAHATDQARVATAHELRLVEVEGLEAASVEPHHHHLLGMGLHTAMALVSSMAAIMGILLAGYFHWLDRDAATRIAQRFPRIVRLLENKYYVDELYHRAIVTPLRLLGELCFAFDRLVIEPLVNLFGFVPRAIGQTVRPAQRGVLQGYGLTMLAGAAAVVLILVWRLNA